MDSFFSGFCISIFCCILLLILLRLTVPYKSKLFGNKSIPYKSKVESTEWLNFVTNRFITHLQSEEAMNKISELVNSKIHPNHFKLLSMGNNPIVKHVATLEMKEADDVRILVPIEWETGPSFDLSFGNHIKIEVDLIKFGGELLVSWPGNSDSDIDVQFIDNIIFDFNLSIIFFKKIDFSPSRVPLLGPIIKGIVSTIISSQNFKLHLPHPATD